ncbi:type II toxin-antitoxin system VapC family toxin [Cellulomonas sp. HZM]|uniref:type II toxin-antitoxin system VapC family toxin n=1 Tax=Cellulomonas sp. HZM TaxID=1454010 RepID=UPI000492EF7F|nr:type II toxin-antitoxin system VapC family toxin [Cellulomonas sp. HZM]
MIVVDASALVEALVGRAPDAGLLDALADEVSAPHLLDVEAMSVLRGLLLGGKISAEAADAARRDLFALTIVRHDLEPLAERVWELRRQFTAYDATYLALAEALGCPLLTCDAKLGARGHRAQVRVLAGAR